MPLVMLLGAALVQLPLEPSKDSEGFTPISELQLAAGQRFDRTVPVTPGSLITVTADCEAPSDGMRVSLGATMSDGEGTPWQRESGETSKEPAKGRRQTITLYFKTHPYASAVTTSVEVAPDSPNVVLHSLKWKVQPDAEPKVSNAALDALILPIWTAKRVVAEPVLPREGKGGRLLLPADRIERVVTSKGKLILAKQYQLSPMDHRRVTFDGPARSDASFSKKELAWYEVVNDQLLVTYQTKGRWQGPVPAASKFLRRTRARIQQGKPIRVVTFGDSITHGHSIELPAGYRPQPTWPQLVRHGISKRTATTLYNTALPGATTWWALDNEVPGVLSLEPDLVVVAFGMNDFWSLTGELFGENVAKLIQDIRKVRPQTDLLLVAPVEFDPEYTRDPTYSRNLRSYAGELSKLKGPGCDVLDMTAISHWMYGRKAPKDLLGNPLHPTDYLSAVYAQGVLAKLGINPRN